MAPLKRWIVYRVEPGPLWGTRAVKIGTVDAADELEAARKAQAQWPAEQAISVRLSPRQS